ncbi:hypothetical protein TSOC_002346 [Tetrabaena socialis]|uniref:Uncharacterized protein n=1 Tax=Tetrabaena socialis TaxID=47790 RepID=A0A2J8AE93_9CHLO|nr:hypothetical protein TSOC_002346 [Tetrabaena socialis]|eukprot:PNH10845.1 hypothetical protein TSOC_002346 [Tetrabaena socialis]
MLRSSTAKQQSSKQSPSLAVVRWQLRSEARDGVGDEPMTQPDSTFVGSHKKQGSVYRGNIMLGSRHRGLGRGADLARSRRPGAVPQANNSNQSSGSQGRIASEVRTPNGPIKWGCYLSTRSTLEAFGVMGGGKLGTTEADGKPALSLTLGSLPGVDLRVFHTLRSSVPAVEAPVDRWAEFVGVPADTNRHVSFLMFSDPRFTQMYQILEGLDYSFPRAAKMGGMLSVGVRSRQRAMFAWSAQQDVRKRIEPSALAAAVTAAPAAASAASLAAANDAPGAEAADAAAGGGGGGWFQRSLDFLSKLTGGAGGGAFEGVLGGDGAEEAAEAAEEEADLHNGMYMYGGVCLVLHGDVKLDTIVSQVGGRVGGQVGPE